jgi:hypothetical protein
MDPAWTDFAEACRDERFAGCPDPDALVRACGGQADLAWALWFHMGAQALDWLQRGIPALDGRRPVDLIARGHGDAVRRCLWSFP